MGRLPSRCIWRLLARLMRQARSPSPYRGKCSSCGHWAATPIYSSCSIVPTSFPLTLPALFSLRASPLRPRLSTLGCCVITDGGSMRCADTTIAAWVQVYRDEGRHTHGRLHGCTRRDTRVRLRSPCPPSPTRCHIASNGRARPLLAVSLRAWVWTWVCARVCVCACVSRVCACAHHLSVTSANRFPQTFDPTLQLSPERRYVGN
jgi:hypothetical protein